MKKFLLTSLALFTIYSITIAQESKTKNFQRNFLALTAGPSFPIGDFGSTDFNNQDAGMAKTGFTVDLSYSYSFDKVSGFVLTAVYGRHSIDKSLIGDGDQISIDPWQYYGIMAGPRVTATLSSKTSFDFAVTSGVAFARFPETTVNSQTITKQDWATTVPVKASGNLKFSMNNSIYIIGGVNYTYMKPKFSVTIQGEGQETITMKQKMNMVGINAGIGFSF